jgi:hypothetical protein
VPAHAEIARSQLIGRQQQKAYHDRRAHDLPSLKPDDVVPVQQRNELTRGVRDSCSPVTAILCRRHGTWLEFASQSSSTNRHQRSATRHPTSAVAVAIVKIYSRYYCNCRAPIGPVAVPPPVPSAMRTTRSGRPVKPPVRFRDYVAS